MDFNSFKSIHENNSPIRLLNSLDSQYLFREMSAVGMAEAQYRHNHNSYQYYKREYDNMNERITWLRGKIIEELKKGVERMSPTEYREDIINYLNKHPELNDKPANEIAKSMILEALWNTPFAEDAYPGVKERLIKIVEEM